MEKETKEKIAQALQEKKVNQPCPRCTKGHFDVVGYHFIPLNPNPNTLVIGGPTVPAVIIACLNCGFITEHALGPLGLMSLVEKKND